MTIPKESPDLVEERKKELKRTFPEVFTEGKIDFNKLRQALGESVETSGERYSFGWAGKSESIRVRDRRSKATLAPSRKESVDFDSTGNVFIEGENLEVLKILQKSYQGKVKMVYIDPPYNTGKDFVYPDDFKDPLTNYLRLTGQVNEKGVKTSTNVETGGRYHSNWLNMMYPRLFLARNLLREDGVIFVSIDDNEVHNLRLIMNEIFGEENFIATAIWQKKQSPQNDATYLSDMHDYIVLYAKKAKTNRNDVEGWTRNLFTRSDEQKERYKNPDNDSRGRWASVDYTCNKSAQERPNLYYAIMNPKSGKEIWPSKQRVWRFDKKAHAIHVKENRIWWGDTSDNFPRLKRYLSEVQGGVVPSTWWDRENFGDNQESKREVNGLFDGAEYFDTPKPTRLIKKMLELATTAEGNELILDFFAGSGTTAHTVLAKNFEDGGHRKFILVQLPESTPEGSEARKAGYKTIADVCKERIRRAIKKLKKEGAQKKLGASEEPDLGFKVFKLSKSNCFVWDEDLPKEQETLIKHVEASAKGASAADKEALLFELMLREGFTLDSKIEEIKEGKNRFCKISDGGHSLWTCFDESIDAEAVKKLPLEKDDKLIVLDSALTDTQKVNLSRKTRIETV